MSWVRQLLIALTSAEWVAFIGGALLWPDITTTSMWVVVLFAIWGAALVAGLVLCLLWPRGSA